MSKRVASRSLKIPPEARKYWNEIKNQKVIWLSNMGRDSKKGEETAGFEDLFSDDDEVEKPCVFEETKTFMQTISGLMEEQQDLRAVSNMLEDALKALELEIEQSYKLGDIAYKAFEFQHGIKTDSTGPSSAAKTSSSASALDP